MIAPGEEGAPGQGKGPAGPRLPFSPAGTAMPSPTPVLHCSPMTSCFLTSKSQIPVPLLWTCPHPGVKCLCLSMQGHLVQRELFDLVLAPGQQAPSRDSAPSWPARGPGRDLGSPGGPLNAWDLAPIAAPRAMDNLHCSE